MDLTKRLRDAGYKPFSEDGVERVGYFGSVEDKLNSELKRDFSEGHVVVNVFGPSPALSGGPSYSVWFCPRKIKNPLERLGLEKEVMTAITGEQLGGAVDAYFTVEQDILIVPRKNTLADRLTDKEYKHIEPGSKIVYGICLVK